MNEIQRRFWDKVDEPDENGCRKWKAAASRGYGAFKLNGKNQQAHRIAYTWAFGDIPEGFNIDHVKARGCRSTLCVEITHLEAVTSRENTLRGTGPAAKNARKTHCPAGHEYTEANTYRYPNGKRECRRCHNDRELTRHRTRKSSSRT